MHFERNLYNGYEFIIYKRRILRMFIKHSNIYTGGLTAIYIVLTNSKILKELKKICSF